VRDRSGVPDCGRSTLVGFSAELPESFDVLQVFVDVAFPGINDRVYRAKDGIHGGQPGIIETVAHSTYRCTVVPEFARGPRFDCVGIDQHGEPPLALADESNRAQQRRKVQRRDSWNYSLVVVLVPDDGEVEQGSLRQWIEALVEPDGDPKNGIMGAVPKVTNRRSLIV